MSKIHKIARGVLAVAAAASVPVLDSVGYTGGTPTTVGLDGGTTRDLVALLFAGAATFYPKIIDVWKSLTNNSRLDALEQRVTALESSRPAAVSAVGPQLPAKTAAGDE